MAAFLASKAAIVFGRIKPSGLRNLHEVSETASN